jgi:hypothetical protein
MDTRFSGRYLGTCSARTLDVLWLPAGLACQPHIGPNDRSSSSNQGALRRQLRGHFSRGTTFAVATGPAKNLAQACINDLRFSSMPERERQQHWDLAALILLRSSLRSGALFPKHERGAMPSPFTVVCECSIM